MSVCVMHICFSKKRVNARAKCIYIGAAPAEESARDAAGTAEMHSRIPKRCALCRVSRSYIYNVRPARNNDGNGCASRARNMPRMHNTAGATRPTMPMRFSVTLYIAFIISFDAGIQSGRICFFFFFY